MTYTLAPFVTAEMLEKEGFYLETESQGNIDDGDYLRDFNDDVQLYVSLRFIPYHREILNNYGSPDIEEKHINIPNHFLKICFFSFFFCSLFKIICILARLMR